MPPLMALFKVSFAKCIHVGLLSLLSGLFFGAKLLSSVSLHREGSKCHSLKSDVNYLKSFCRRHLFFPFIYSYIYLYHLRLTHIQFMFLVIIQHYVIYVAPQVVPALAIGSICRLALASFDMSPPFCLFFVLPFWYYKVLHAHQTFIFSVLMLESAMSPRSPSSFYRDWCLAL